MNKTDFDLVTEVIDGKDGGGVYTDKEVISSDLPAYLGLGLSYTPNDRLTLAILSSSDSLNKLTLMEEKKRLKAIKMKMSLP